MPFRIQSLPGAGRFVPALLDFWFPRTCVRCGCLLGVAERGFTCRDCRRKYVLIQPPFCDRCGFPFAGKLAHSGTCESCRERPPDFREARSLFLYRMTGARVVHCLKYEKGTWLLPEITALLEDGEGWRDFFEGSTLVPVPLHSRKVRQRGFNQADIVCKAIRRVVPGVGIFPCLRRIRATPSQTFLSRAARLRNMKGAFSCPALPEKHGRLVLVDDVHTTGATLNAASRALHEAGAKVISAFTLAHG
ncbi:MAG TPA: ComF family protein [Oceanipulchritudo sp.]|nr:ComF family protein [Oceanipulchritudo sp.]